MCAKLKQTKSVSCYLVALENNLKLHLMETAANKLLQIFLELKFRIRLEEDWENHIDRDTSIAILYRQFTTLAKYLCLQFDTQEPSKVINNFEQGGFIRKRSLKVYTSVALELEAHEPWLAGYVFWEKIAFRYRQLENLFRGLIHFKLQTDFRYHEQLEGLEVGASYAHSLKLLAINQDTVDKINQLICQIIDPTFAIFDVAKMKDEIDYPKDDYDSKYLKERVNEEF